MVSTSNAFAVLRSGEQSAAPARKRHTQLDSVAYGAPPALTNGEHAPRAPNAGGGARPEAPVSRGDEAPSCLEAAACDARDGPSMLKLLTSWAEKLVRGVGICGNSRLERRAPSGGRAHELYLRRPAAAPPRVAHAPAAPAPPQASPPHVNGSAKHHASFKQARDR